MSEIWKTTMPDLLLGQVIRPGITEVSVSRHTPQPGVSKGDRISIQINERDMCFDLETGEHLGSGVALWDGPSKDWEREYDKVNQGANKVEPTRRGTRI